MSWGQRNIDFCNAQTNAQMAYIEAEREVVRLEAENAKLRGLCSDMYEAVPNACGECWMRASGNPAKCDNKNCGYRRNYERMRELGIEVGE